MTDLLLNPQTEEDIDNYIAGKSHALLLTGPSGGGKQHLTLYLTRALLKLDEHQLENYPYFLHVVAEKTSIGIEEVRKLQSFLQLKTTGTDAVRRVVIIEDAHSMTQEAQNALLKSLEEPPADTVIILTAVKSDAILDTIYSRVQTLAVQSPSLEQAQTYFVDKGTSAEIQRAYAISGGLVGLMSAILTDDTSHPLLQKVLEARKLLSLKPYERLVQANELDRDKSSVSELLYALKQTASAALGTSGKAGKITDVKRWHQVLSEVNRAEEHLAVAGNTKLVLTDLLLNL